MTFENAAGRARVNATWGGCRGAPGVANELGRQPTPETGEATAAALRGRASSRFFAAAAPVVPRPSRCGTRPCGHHFGTRPLPSPTLRLAAAGFLATAVAYGPARMGFGLFLPAFREDFALSTPLAALIASTGFAAFLGALLLTAWLGARVGERALVVAGALAAAAGFAAVASAGGSALLATGVALAGTSAGLCWSPFNDAAERVVPADTRAGALSAVSTGTTLGVAAAGVLALAVTYGALDWRAAWGVFAGVGVAAAILAYHGVPGGRPAAHPAATGAPAAKPRLLRREVAPLYAAALCFGATNAAYLSFAADRVVTAGGLAGVPQEGASAVIFVGYGLCGLVGLATGALEARTGLAPLLGAIFAALAGSLALIALAPGSWSAVVGSAGLHGAAVMMVSAVFAFWSLRLFPGRGSFGFTVALVFLAAGSVAGPAIVGTLVDVTNATTAFLVGATPSALLAAFFAIRRPEGSS